jgi:ArsR family transcriptional regulator
MVAFHELQERLHPELAHAAPSSQQKIRSTLLHMLRDAGLLTSQRRASWVYYAVVPETLMALSELLRTGVDAATPIGASA